MAHVLFGTPPTPDRASTEHYAIERFREWLGKSDKKVARIVCDFADESLTPLLSGSNLLELAKMIEAHSPEIVPMLRNIGKLRRHLEQAEQLSAVFAPQTIDKMIRALIAEDQGGGQAGAPVGLQSGASRAE